MSLWNSKTDSCSIDLYVLPFVVGHLFLAQDIVVWNCWVCIDFVHKNHSKWMQSFRMVWVLMSIPSDETLPYTRARATEWMHGEWWSLNIFVGKLFIVCRRTQTHTHTYVNLFRCTQHCGTKLFHNPLTNFFYSITFSTSLSLTHSQAHTRAHSAHTLSPYRALCASIPSAVPRSMKMYYNLCAATTNQSALCSTAVTAVVTVIVHSKRRTLFGTTIFHSLTRIRGSCDILSLALAIAARCHSSDSHLRTHCASQRTQIQTRNNNNDETKKRFLYSCGINGLRPPNRSSVNILTLLGLVHFTN